MKRIIILMIVLILGVIGIGAHRINGYRYLAINSQGNPFDVEIRMEKFFTKLGFKIVRLDDFPELSREQGEEALIADYQYDIVYDGHSSLKLTLKNVAVHHSSLTDYLDSVLGDSREMQNRIDNLVMRYRLGAVDKTKNEHFGTILPRINKKGMIVGGSVIYYNTDGGTIIEKDSLVAHLYSWYAFDYYVDPDVFFGEHLFRNGKTVIVQEEKTALLGSLAFPNTDWLAVGIGNNLTEGMMKKLMGRQVVLYPDDFCHDFWAEHFGGRFKVDDSFTQRDINQYLIDFIHNQQVP